MILILGACGNSEVEDTNVVGDDQTVYPDEETSSSKREATIGGISNANSAHATPTIEELMEQKERLEDFIAEQEAAE